MTWNGPSGIGRGGSVWAWTDADSLSEKRAMTGASKSMFSAVRMCHSGEAMTAAQSASVRLVA